MARAKTAAKTESFSDLGDMDFVGNIAQTTTELGFFHRGGEEYDVPSPATERSAGMDLRAFIQEGAVYNIYNVLNQKLERKVRPPFGDNAPRIILEPGDRVLVPTGLHANIPEGHWLAIHPRSGSSWKEGKGLTNSVAVIDEDYVEEIFVSVHNLSGTRINIEHGERIAQAVLHARSVVPVVKLNEKPTTKTSRTGGFGHTGKN